MQFLIFPKFTFLLIFFSLIIFTQEYEISEIVDRAEKIVDNRNAEAFKSGRGFSRKKTTPNSRKMSRRNSVHKEAIRILTEEEGVEEAEARSFVFPGDFCSPETVQCNFNSRDRKIDGTCNNVNNPRWGSKGQRFKRLVSPWYNDGQNEPRGGLNNLQNHGVNYYLVNNYYCPYSDNLPNPRVVSVEFHPDRDFNANVATHMVAQFGQFLDHDISLTPEEEVENCCSNPAQSECFPIDISPNDDFYSTVSQDCLEFSRSTAFCQGQQNIREQFNDITAFIDGSNIYGSDNFTANELRLGVGGLLKSANFTQSNSELLPQIDGEWRSGDTRAQEMPGLAAMHTLFIREHNRIAKGLVGNDDEELYQRARRVVIAEMQNIVYKEYLPLVIGASGMGYYGLEVPSFGQTSTYNPNINPNIANSFATAAYRFGHSLIQGDIQMIDAFNINTTFQLRDNFNNLNSNNIFRNQGLGVESLLRGLVKQPAQRMDRFVTEDVTNFLFKMPNSNFGSDLVARNIQRGRDHGLGSYNDYREYCGLSRICSWYDYDKPAEFSWENWYRLQSLYEFPENIDLFVGGMAEIPEFGGLTGPTFNCIKAWQFVDLKYGDRFFYSHTNYFTQYQLEQLKQRTLSDIICENTNFQDIRVNVFDLHSGERSCNQNNLLDLSAF